MNNPIRVAVAQARGRADTPDAPVPRVLMLHGIGGSVRDWDALAQLLAVGAEPWSVSLPWSATGDPAWARDPDVTRRVAEPIDNFRRRADRGPEVLVAHSFAANLVLELLTRSNALAATPTVLISPFYRRAGADLDWNSVAPRMKDCYERVDAEIRRRRGSCVNDEIRELMLRRLLELVGDHAPVRFYQTFLSSSELALEAVTAPLLVVVGSDDSPAVTEGVRCIANRIPHARLEFIDRCGHFPMTEHAGELARLIEDFIDQTLPGSDRHCAPEE